MDIRVKDNQAPVTGVRTGVYTIPTDAPESDGTLAWDETTLILVEIDAGGHTGIGFTYGHPCLAPLIETTLAEQIQEQDALDIPACWWRMIRAIRNLGRPGLCSMAISAVDIALWDLKGKLLGQSLTTLLGAVRDRIPVYGSGGFTSYNRDQLEAQLGDWVRQGIRQVKMKIARHPHQDRERIQQARSAIGEAVELFVDANGGFSRKQALGWMPYLHEQGVTWFEEPVSSDDLEGLRLLRDNGPGDIAITAGEYGYHTPYFRQMLDAGGVDVMQADATRCSGITGICEVAALCEGFLVPLSTHTAPSIHAHVACALHPVRHVEWFHDHVRIERMLFDGTLKVVDGCVQPDPARPGLGLEFKRKDAERYAQ